MKFRHKRVVATTLLIILLLAALTVSYGYDPADSAFPQIDELFKNNSNPFISEYRDNYHLDMKNMGLVEGAKHPEHILNPIANMFFSLQKYLTIGLITIVYYAYEIDLYSLFSTMIDSVFAEMKIVLFDELSSLAIVLLGFYYCIKIISDQKTQIWVAILQTVVILVLALALFHNPTAMLKGVDDFSKDMSKSVLAGTYRATNQGASPESAVLAASNDIWMMFVHKPWQMLEFGSLEVAEQEQHRVLSLAPNSDERNAIIEELANDGKHFQSDWGVRRLAFMLLYMLPMLAMGLIIGLLALLILGYQFLTIFFTLGGIFVFILALIPFIGPSVINNWAVKVIANGLIKVIISFVLAIIFAVNAALFNLIGVYGWFVVLLLQILMMGIIVWKRKDFVDLFTNTRKSLQSGNIKPSKKDFNLEGKLRMENGRLGFGKKGPGYQDEFDEVESSSGSRTYIRNDKGSRRRRDSTSGDIFASKTEGFEVKLANEAELSHMNESLKALTRKAEELLNKKYEDELQEAEKHGEKLGKEPEYSSFVKRVKTREELGAPRFDNREISSVVKSLQIAQFNGSTAEDVYKGLTTQEAPETERPKNIESIRLEIGGGSQELDKKEAYSIVEQQQANDHAEAFNSRYNTKYDKAFFEGLFKKYGQENVDMMLERMKDVEEREDKTINNPAGYLTTSLKNNQRDKVLEVEKRQRAAGGEATLSDMRKKANKEV